MVAGVTVVEGEHDTTIRHGRRVQLSGVDDVQPGLLHGLQLLGESLRRYRIGAVGRVDGLVLLLVGVETVIHQQRTAIHVFSHRALTPPASQLRRASTAAQFISTNTPAKLTSRMRLKDATRVPIAAIA